MTLYFKVNGTTMGKRNSCSPYVSTEGKVKVAHLLDTNEIKATARSPPTLQCNCVRQFSSSTKPRVHGAQETGGMNR